MCCRYVVSALAKSVDVALALGPMVSQPHTVQLQHSISSWLLGYDVDSVTRMELFCIAVALEPRGNR